MKMASLTFHSVDSALRDLVLLMADTGGDIEYLNVLMLKLKGLKIFLHLATKLGDPILQVRLGSILVRTNDAISRYAPKIRSRYAPEIQPCYLGLKDRYHLFIIILDYDTTITSIGKEIEEWDTIFSDSLHLHLSCPLTLDEALEIFDYALEINNHSLREAIKVFRKFIYFVKMHSVEPRRLKSFVIHITVFAINAAQLTAHLLPLFRLSPPNPHEILPLLQKIKPVEPRVFKAYKTTLAFLKSSTELQHCPTQDHDRRLVIMKDFVDFLLWSLREMPTTDPSLMISIKDQAKLLFDELRYLRTIMKRQPNKFDERIGDLSRVVLCDAGVLVFSLYQKDAQIDVGLPDLLEMFKTIWVEVGVQAPETSIFDLPKTSILDFLKFLFDCLMAVKSSKVDSDAQTHIQAIEQDLSYLRSVLEDLVKVKNQDEDLQALWNHGVQVASEMKNFIGQLVLGDIPNSFSTDITSFKTHVLKSFHGRRREIEVLKVTQTSAAQMTPQNSVQDSSEFVGFESEKILIIDRLTRGSKNLEVIAIVGMAGLGKTTMVTNVYNDRRIVCHFPVRRWCTVSQVYNRKKSLLELLNNNMPLEESEHELSQKLWRSLKGRRYLVVLDDVWDIEALDSLKVSLPDDGTGSRILVTSRYHKVAPNYCWELRHLHSAESWELLQKKLFPTEVLPELGKQIADKCKGLPLTIVIVAGILATLEPEPDGWKQVLESLNSRAGDQCRNVLEMSYKHLPDYLKHCLLYFGFFSEDEEVSVKKLIWLWIAEGFINKTGLESLEDVAFGYMMDLASRSLIMVFEKGSKTRGKSCRIHDLLHEFCISKAKEENFFQRLNAYDEILAFREPYYSPRLSIHSKAKDFEYLRLFHPNTHSLLLLDDHYREGDMIPDISVIISVFKHLKVFYVPRIPLGSVFPSNIQLLIQLTYLEIKGMWHVVPSSIGNLSNLETFIMEKARGQSPVALPNTIWNLHRLRHLHVLRCFEFSTENLDNSSSLLELKSCYTAVVFSPDSREKLVRKFPNVEKLKWELCEEWDTKNCNKIIIHDSLARLRSLDLGAFSRKSSWSRSRFWRSVGGVGHVEFEFGFPPSLTKLTLRWFPLSQRQISSLGKLPNLEVLKLLYIKFHGGRFDMVEGEFSKLRFLKLSGRNLVRWTADDDQFPNLQKLVLQRCGNLEEIPSCCLENTSTLERIEVLYCPESVEELVKQIREVHKDFGNSYLETRILNRENRGF